MRYHVTNPEQCMLTFTAWYTARYFIVKKNDYQNKDRLYDARIQFKLQLKMFKSTKHLVTDNTSRWLIIHAKVIYIGSFAYLEGKYQLKFISGTFSGEMQMKKAANKAMDRRNFLGCGGVLITSEQSHAVDRSTFNSLCNNLERWVVTQRTSNKPQNWPNWGGVGGGGLFGDGHLRGDGLLPRII